MLKNDSVVSNIFVRQFSKLYLFQDQQPMELPQGKPVLIFVFNILNPTQATTDTWLIDTEFNKCCRIFLIVEFISFVNLNIKHTTEL
jgi:hypothetical protein